MKYTDLCPSDKKPHGITITWESYDRKKGRKKRNQNFHLHHSGRRTSHAEHETNGEDQAKQGKKARKKFQRMEG